MMIGPIWVGPAGLANIKAVRCIARHVCTCYGTAQQDTLIVSRLPCPMAANARSSMGVAALRAATAARCRRHAAVRSGRG